MTKYNEFVVQTTQTICLTDNAIKQIVTQRLNNRHNLNKYKVVDGVLYAYERVSWDDYDWCKCIHQNENIIKNVEKMQQLQSLMDEFFNE